MTYVLATKMLVVGKKEEIAMTVLSQPQMVVHKSAEPVAYADVMRCIIEAVMRERRKLDVNIITKEEVRKFTISILARDV